MKAFFTSIVLLMATAVSTFGAPTSDGSFFLETFENYPEHSSSQTFPVAMVLDGVLRLTTVRPNEGAFRASPLALGDEWVAEFDWTVHAPTGDFFHMFYADEAVTAPWHGAIGMRVWSVETDSNWTFEVSHAEGSEFSAVMNFNQTYHFTIHVQPGPTKPVDLYVDGVLFNSYNSRNPQLDVDLVQWGDLSSTDAFGDITLDNISIGLPVDDEGIPGDFDGDDFVDGDDLVEWENNFGPGDGADADDDGDSDGNDFLIWQRNLGMGNPNATSVPEPTSWAMGIVAICTCGWMRKFRKARREG